MGNSSAKKTNFNPFKTIASAVTKATKDTFGKSNCVPRGGYQDSSLWLYRCKGLSKNRCESRIEWPVGSGGRCFVGSLKKLPKCNWIQKNTTCQRTSKTLKTRFYNEKRRRQRIINQLYGVRIEFNQVTKILDKELKTYNKLMMMFKALKSVCFNAEDDTKKSKLRLMKSLSGRYLDRVNLLESQKNLLNKQGLLLSEKLDKHTENKDTLEDLDDKLMTSDRKTLLDLKGSRGNTKTIWFLKNLSYILAIVLIYFILKKL